VSASDEVSSLEDAAPALRLDVVPPAPRTPSSRARKLVYGYRGSQGAVLVIGVAFLVIGTLIAGIFGGGLVDDLRLAAMAREVDATVIDVSVVANVKVNGAHPRAIHFRYAIDGASYEATSSTLDGAILQRAVPGASIRAEVLASSPDVARVVGTTCASMGYVGLFVLIFPAIGGALAFAAWRSNRREVRAFSRGVPILADVVYEGPDRSTRVNGRHPYQIRWEFEVDGERFSGSISAMERTELGGLTRAGKAIVLYDAAGPKASTLYVG
jgi:hypothetical protein